MEAKNGTKEPFLTNKGDDTLVIPASWGPECAPERRVEHVAEPTEGPFFDLCFFFVDVVGVSSINTTRLS
jgi:hypothetical protein